MDIENEQIESTTSDVSPESSSETQETSTQEQQNAGAQAPVQQDSSANLPFHQHPRWIERDNELKAERAARQQLEQSIADMQKRFTEMQKAPAGPDERTELLKRLEGIDPAFGKLISELVTTPKELQELKAWKQEYEAQQTRAQAVSTVSSLHEQNKVDGELKDLINEALVAMDAQGKIKNVQDIPRAYKEVHERLSKYVDSIKRGVTASYVSDKKTDGKVPTSQPKGAPVKSQGNKIQFNTRDREAGLSQVVSQYLKSKSGSTDL